MNRNIVLSYIITVFEYTWFWMGIWVLYYAQFGGYSAVGILETVMIVTVILTEIPTGAIADLLGKKKTMIIGFFLGFIASMMMAYAPSIFIMAVALVILNIGGTLISGSFEALVYDSLKQEGKELKFDRVISNLTTLRLLALAVFGIIGGYIATFGLSIPFILNGVGLLIASILSFFIIEPRIDTEKFTIKGYINQNIEGIKHLFRSSELRKLTIGLLAVSVIMVIMWDGVNDILILDFGFKNNEVLLGIFASIFTLAGAFASYIYPRVFKKTKKYVFILIIGLYALSIIISPLVTMYLGVLTILVRNILDPILSNIISAKLNRNIDSKYRATSLSTFAMIKGIPYALTIYFIASLTDIYPSQYIAAVFGLILFIFLIYNALLPKKYFENTNN